MHFQDKKHLVMKTGPILSIKPTEFGIMWVLQASK